MKFEKRGRPEEAIGMVEGCESVEPESSGVEGDSGSGIEGCGCQLGGME